jgi:hypothetical protein
VKTLEIAVNQIDCPKNITQNEEDFEVNKDYMPFITDLGLIHVINNCPQINSIVFFVRPNITEGTIDVLIALAFNLNILFMKSKILIILIKISFSLQLI